MRRPTDSSKLAPAALLVVAAIFFTVALVGAFTVDPTRPPEALRDESGSKPNPGDVPLPETTLWWKALESAADQDPFQTNRRRTPSYRLLGERGQVEVSEPMPPPPPPPSFEVIGTVVTPTGGSVLVQTEGGSSYIVMQGQDMEGYRLEGVTLGGATFARVAGPHHSVHLAVVPPGERGSSARCGGVVGDGDGCPHRPARLMSPEEGLTRWIGGAGPTVVF